MLNNKTNKIIQLCDAKYVGDCGDYGDYGKRRGSASSLRGNIYYKYNALFKILERIDCVNSASKVHKRSFFHCTEYYI